MGKPFQPKNKENLDKEQFTDSCRQALGAACPITSSRGKIRPPGGLPYLRKLRKSQASLFWINFGQEAFLETKLGSEGKESS